MKKETLQWHPGFYAALQIEFEEEQEKLVFENEHQLSKKPMAIDAVVIKVKPGIRIEKNIGIIFKEHNIMEYKSPEDYLSINDYYKVLGYACFYQADTPGVCQVRPEELTLTYVCSHVPRKLLDHLSTFLHVGVEQVGAGIYYLTGTMFPTQILVTGELSKADNFWLSRLRTNLEVEEDLDPLSRAYKEKRKDSKYEAVMDLLIRANHEKAEEAKYMCDAIRELFADEWEEAEKKSIEKGIDQLTKLLQILEEEHKQEELSRAIRDKEFREELYKQYGL